MATPSKNFIDPTYLGLYGQYSSFCTFIKINYVSSSPIDKIPHFANESLRIPYVLNSGTSIGVSNLKPRIPTPPMGRQVILTFPPIYRERPGGTTTVVTVPTRPSSGQVWPRFSGALLDGSTTTTTTPADTTTGPAASPHISGLYISPGTVTSGGSASITPVFTNPDSGSATIDNGIGPVVSGEIYNTGAVTSNKTYTLTVINKDNVAATASKTLTTTSSVAPLPSIISFVPSLFNAHLGTGGSGLSYAVDSVSFTPEFINGTGVIDNGIGSVVSGQKYVYSFTLLGTPTYITFKLTVTNSDGAVASQSVVVSLTYTPTATVPVVTSFTISPATVASGSSATITPVFTNPDAGNSIIDNGIGPVISGVGYNTGAITGDKTFNLILSNRDGVIVTNSAHVGITNVVTGNAVPTITSFTASKTNVVMDEIIALYPVYSNPNPGGASISYLSVDTLAGTSTQVAATLDPSINSGTGILFKIRKSPDTYTLKVWNKDNVAATATLNVFIGASTVPDPVITSFAVSPTTVPTGTAPTASPAFTGGVASITCQETGLTINNVVSGTAYPLSVSNAAATYVLRVTNSLGVFVTSSVTTTPVVGYPAVTIDSFSVAQDTYYIGSNATITFSFSNSGGEAYIDAIPLNAAGVATGVGSTTLVTNSMSPKLYPALASNTKFTLRVYDPSKSNATHKESSFIAIAGTPLGSVGWNVNSLTVQNYFVEPGADTVVTGVWPTGYPAFVYRKVGGVWMNKTAFSPNIPLTLTNISADTDFKVEFLESNGTTLSKTATFTVKAITTGSLVPTHIDTPGFVNNLANVYNKGTVTSGVLSGIVEVDEPDSILSYRQECTDYLSTYKYQILLTTSVNQATETTTVLGDVSASTSTYITSMALYYPAGKTSASVLITGSSEPCIRTAVPAGSNTSTLFVGHPTTKGFSTYGVGTDVRLKNPCSICYNKFNGLMYFVDTGNHALYSLDYATKTVNLVVGNGTSGTANGTPSVAMLSSPYRCCIDNSNGDIIIIEENNYVNKIRRVAMASGNVTTITSNISQPPGYPADVMNVRMKMNSICTDASGNIYLGNDTCGVFEVTPAGVSSNIITPSTSYRRLSDGSSSLTLTAITRSIANVSSVCVSSRTNKLYLSSYRTSPYMFQSNTPDPQVYAYYL